MLSHRVTIDLMIVIIIVMKIIIIKSMRVTYICHDDLYHISEVVPSE